MPFDAFLNIDTVKGESADAKHKGEIDILNFRWGAKNRTTIGSATGGAGGGKVQFNELVITKTIDNASPLLFKACTTGQHFNTVTLVIRKAGGKQLEYMTITFTTVFVTSITPDFQLPQSESTAKSGDALPTEEVIMVFGKVNISYQPQGSDGAAKGGPVLAGWDQLTNKKA